jgi:hypothetical protein
MLKMRKPLLALCLTTIVLLGSGCELFYILGLPFGNRVPYNPKKVSSNTAVKRDVQFFDIPVPMGFLLRRDEFFSYKCPTFRMGNFKYDGAWTYRHTYRFYMRQMAIEGWQKLHEEDGYGTNLTKWTKPGETLELKLDCRGKKVHVFIKVRPIR